MISRTQNLNPEVSKKFQSNSFYSFYFGITEKNTGFRIGGEFRGIYGSTELPFYNIFITKTLAIGDISKALSKGED